MAQMRLSVGPDPIAMIVCRDAANAGDCAAPPARLEPCRGHELRRQAGTQERTMPCHHGKRPVLTAGFFRGASLYHTVVVGKCVRVQRGKYTHDREVVARSAQTIDRRVLSSPTRSSAAVQRSTLPSADPVVYRSRA
jgi:hypothetical protein